MVRQIRTEHWVDQQWKHAIKEVISVKRQRERACGTKENEDRLTGGEVGRGVGPSYQLKKPHMGPRVTDVKSMW